MERHLHRRLPLTSGLKLQGLGIRGIRIVQREVSRTGRSTIRKLDRSSTRRHGLVEAQGHIGPLAAEQVGVLNGQSRVVVGVLADGERLLIRIRSLRPGQILRRVTSGHILGGVDMVALRRHEGVGCLASNTGRFLLIAARHGDFVQHVAQGHGGQQLTVVVEGNSALILTGVRLGCELIRVDVVLIYIRYQLHPGHIRGVVVIRSTILVRIVIVGLQGQRSLGVRRLDVHNDAADHLRGSGGEDQLHLTGLKVSFHALALDKRSAVVACILYPRTVSSLDLELVPAQRGLLHTLRIISIDVDVLHLRAELVRGDGGHHLTGVRIDGVDFDRLVGIVVAIIVGGLRYDLDGEGGILILLGNASNRLASIIATIRFILSLTLDLTDQEDIHLIVRLINSLTSDRQRGIDCNSLTGCDFRQIDLSQHTLHEGTTSGSQADGSLPTSIRLIDLDDVFACQAYVFLSRNGVRTHVLQGDLDIGGDLTIHHHLGGGVTHGDASDHEVIGYRRRLSRHAAQHPEALAKDHGQHGKKQGAFA